MVSLMKTNSGNFSDEREKIDSDITEILHKLEQISSAAIPPKLYRIGEVVEFSGFSRQTIHNYTAMGLIRESKWTSSGHRLYEEDVFHRLEAIKQLKDSYPLLRIKEAFDRKDSMLSGSTE